MARETCACTYSFGHIVLLLTWLINTFYCRDWNILLVFLELLQDGLSYVFLIDNKFFLFKWWVFRALYLAQPCLAFALFHWVALFGSTTYIFTDVLMMLSYSCLSDQETFPRFQDFSYFSPLYMFFGTVYLITAIHRSAGITSVCIVRHHFLFYAFF